MRSAYVHASSNGAGHGSAAYDTESFPNLRRALHPDLRSLPAEDIDAIVRARFGPAVSAEDVEGFLDDIGKVMGKVGQNLLSNLPQIAMGAVQGGMVGGLPGAIAGAAIPAVGAALPAVAGAVAPAAGAAIPGAVAATAMGAAGGRPGTPVHAATPGGASGAAQAPSVPSGAAGQLLQMLANPALFQSIVSALFQSSGAPKTVVGGTPTPVPAVLNAVSELAGRAAEDYSLATDPAFASLRGPSGETLDDPASALERAESVAGLFARPVPASIASESDGAVEAVDDESYSGALTEAEYDEMDEQDLEELYAAGEDAS